MKTTLNIGIDLLAMIAKAAESRGVSTSEMIAILLKRVTVNMENPGRIGSLVRYQKRRRSGDWHKFHLKVREDMYEYMLDLRKLLKVSVSGIVALAAKKFLTGSIKIKDSDNYLCNCYFIIREVADSAIIWKLIWGCPPNIK